MISAFDIIRLSRYGPLSAKFTPLLSLDRARFRVSWLHMRYVKRKAY